jgi:hypothetical protein
MAAPRGKAPSEEYYPKFPNIEGGHTRAIEKFVPARSAFGANGLALGGEVEIEGVAYWPRER